MLTKRDPYDRLENLDAMSAIKAWLLGDYKRGEERVLILAIRRETGLELTDSEIRDVLIEAVNDNTSAMGVFERLLCWRRSRTKNSPSPSRVDLDRRPPDAGRNTAIKTPSSRASRALPQGVGRRGALALPPGGESWITNGGLAGNSRRFIAFSFSVDPPVQK